MNIDLSSLSGYKSYLSAAGAGLSIFAEKMGWITHDQSTQMLETFGVMYGIFIRQAISKTAQVTQLNPNVVKPEVNTAITQGALVIPDGKPKPKAS